MRRQIIKCVCFAVLLMLPAAAISQSNTSKEIEGQIVAVLYRCRDCKEWNGDTAVAVEYWIVLIKDSAERKKPSFAYVQYEIYEGGISDADLSQKIRFLGELNRKDAHERSRCDVKVDKVKNGIPVYIMAEPGDYDLIVPEMKEKLPSSFESMPCYIVQKKPVFFEAHSETNRSQLNRNNTFKTE